MKNKILSIVLITLCTLTLALVLPDALMGDNEPIVKEKIPTEKSVNSGCDTLGNGENISGTDGISIRSNGKDYSIADYITMRMEFAYHEGQKDFLSGDIRIDSNTHQWIKSPWDGKDTSSVLYKPVTNE